MHGNTGGAQDAQFAAECLSPSTAEQSRFQCRQRARHVYAEALRVLRFVELCSAGTAGTAARLGDLMNASHRSCSEDFHCSCPELDRLTQLCRDAGALGSRLTGAGWGGCTVSLVPAHATADFLRRLAEQYYTPSVLGSTPLDAALFATQPGPGACVLHWP